MYGIMAVHEGHAYIGMVEGLPREMSEVIHHTYGCIGLSRTASEHIAIAHCTTVSIVCAYVLPLFACMVQSSGV